MFVDYIREGMREKGLKVLGMNCKCLIIGFVKCLSMKFNYFFRFK